MKKNFSSIFLLLGTIIGAGFCSGKEICVYFARFGFSSLFFLPLFFVIYYFLFKTFLNLGRKKDYTDFSSFNADYGKSKFFDFALVATYVVFSAAMFAGVGEMTSLYFGGTVKIIVLTVVFVLCLIMLTKDFANLKIVNTILIPLILVVMICVCICSFFATENQVYFETIKGAELVFVTPIIYASQGIALSYYILVKAGRETTPKSAKFIAAVSAGVLTAILAMAIIAFNLHPSVKDEAMPFVMLTFKLGFPFDLIYAPILLFAIFTTLLSTTRALNDFVKKFIKNQWLAAFLTCGITLFLSMFGFSSIIESLYPIIGCLGVIIVLKILLFKKKQELPFAAKQKI